jgi:CRISPR/Cas system-associated exonuclease Cas4 (RecB family)
MSTNYKVPRQPAWNYGGTNWKLSRSKIELYMRCPRCFYLDNKLGVKHVPGYPFNLNSAVDTLLKKEFDSHRMNDTQHPLLEKYGVDAKPVSHDMLDEWRENFMGVKCDHEPTEMTISGAIDDLWINSNDEYIVVDYKSTSKNEVINELNQDWHDGYKRQMDIYQWLLRQNGLKVSNTGYFVYCNGNTEKEAFNEKIEFEVTLIAYEGNDSWIETTLSSIKECLESDEKPQSADECHHCAYWYGRRQHED